jgi:ribosomal protein S2
MVLSQKEADVRMMLAADVHLGTKNCDFQMERYVWKRRSDEYAYTSPFSSSLSLFLVSQR